MSRFGRIVIVCMVGAILGTAAAQAQNVVVAVPARAGAVDGTTENSDAFIWRLFIEFAAPATRGTPSPVAFETWASDDDTFSPTPHWPTPGEPLQLRASVLSLAKRVGARIDCRLCLAFSVACQRIRVETGVPRPIIRLSTLHPSFASVR
jgi:hypothetical protein